MADKQSKIDKLIAEGATAEELAQVRYEDETSLKGILRQPIRDAKAVGRAIVTPGPDPLHPAELAGRRAHADHLAKMEQRRRDIQETARDKLARMKRATQTQAWPPPPTSEQE